MSERVLDDWLDTYLKYSSYSEAPDLFHFWVGAWTIAGALRRRVWLEQGYFQWTPNMYLILVAPPGVVSKSTTLSIGANLLRQIQGIKFGPDAITWQALTQALSEANESVQMPDGAWYPMSCLTIASSEFGTFFNPNDREMVDVLVSLWDGQVGTWEKRTKTQGADLIINPWINIAACTTPGWIAGSFPEYLIGGGFTSRCIFVYAEKKRRLIAYPGRVIPPEFKELQGYLVHDLEQISTVRGPYTMTDAAVEYGERWYQEHNDTRPRHLDNERFGGYLARKQTHIHKLAMLLAAAKSDDRILHAETLEEAAQHVTLLEENMTRVFGYIGVEGAAKHSMEVLSVIRTYGKIKQTDLFKQVFRIMSYREFEEALAACTRSNQVYPEVNGDSLYWIFRHLQ